MDLQRIVFVAFITVFIAYSQASGNSFSPSYELSTLIDDGNVLVINGINPYDKMRTVRNAGDVNGDGIDDVIMGAFGANPNGILDAGQSYVVFGRAEGLEGAALDLADLNGANGFSIDGLNEGDQSGKWVMGLGDINADGIDDVITGSYAADPNGNGSGQSYVVFGSTEEFSACLKLSELDGNNGFSINGVAAGDRAGYVNIAGDVNSDGNNDVLIGAAYADPNGITDAGETYVVLGHAGGFNPSIELANLDGSNGFVLRGINPGDQTGFSVAGAEDLNGDGVHDLIIGAAYADPNGITDAGETYIVFGNPAGFEASLELSTLDGMNGYVIKGIEMEAASGRAVNTAGDVNGDGVGDIVIGSCFADPNGITDAGKAYVVFGNAVGSGAGLDLSALDGTNGFAINGVDPSDFTGRNVSSAGDVNGDGLDDLFIGARGPDTNGIQGPGKAYVVFGSTEPFSPVLELSSLDGNNGFLIRGLDEGDRFGRQVSVAGDMNVDGSADLIIVAGRGDPNGVIDAGEAYVIFSFNLTPELNPIGVKMVTEGQPLDFTVTASDPDAGDILTLTANPLPPNAAFTDNGDGTGDFSWLTEPGDADNSPYDVTFTVTDSEGESDFEVVNITVHAEGQDGVFQQDPGPQGIVSIEAENYHNNLPQGGHSWDLEVNSGASGGLAMQASPDSGTNNDTGYVTASPRLDYDINFVQTGTYYIWVRGFAFSGSSDSVHAGLDGIDLDSAARIKGFDPDNEWVWENGLPRKTINITSGIHTLNLWMREDGFSFDKVVLTNDPDFVPEGFGPQESPTNGSVPNRAPVLNPIGSQNVTEGQLLDFTVTASDPDAGDILTLTANPLPPNAAFTDNGDGTGDFSWLTEPGDADNSPYDVTFTVTDSEVESDFEVVNITVHAEGQDGVFQQDPGPQGIVSIEAENYHYSLPQGGHSWDLEVNSGASGGSAMQASPDSGTNNDTGYVTASPRLDYDINFVQTGTYYIWVRGFAFSGSSDSVHAGLDGIDLDSAARIKGFDPDNEWVWENGLPRKTINITSGIHTLNLWMREDGFSFDKVVLTNDPDFVPEGFGPQESPTNGSVPNRAPVLNPIGSQNVTEGQLLDFTVTASDPDAGDILTLTANPLPPNAAFTDNGDGTGDFSWLTEPGDADNSPYGVTFTVTDSEVESDFEVVNITVHAEGQDGVFQQDPGPQGIVSIEAENYHYSLPQGGHSWDLEVNSGASGGSAMQASPDSGTNNDTGYVTASPRLDYDINFVQTGTYYIWVRGFAFSGSSDSVHAGLDGIDLDSAARIKGFDPDNEWVWENGLPRKTINITSGIHTLNLWMREDGFSFDKVVLTNDPDFVPEGFGPQESPTNGSVPNRAPVLNPIGSQNVTEGQLLDFTVTASDPDAGDILTLTANPLPPNAAFTDNGDGTGDFSWLTEPGDADNSPYDVTFTVTDSEVESDFEVVNITVHAEGQDGVFQQDPGPQGIVSIEAENYHYSLPQGGHSWDLEVNSGASGGSAMQASPDSGTNNDTGYVTASPRLDYDINFVQTGTYYIWVRGFAFSGSSDSVHAGLDGIDLDSAARIKGFDPDNEWVWENGLPRKTINITSGIHTLNLWMREDGFSFDKVVLTNDPDFVPEGFGPQESPTNGSVPNRAPVLNPIGSQNVTEGQLLDFTVTASDPDAGDILTLTANPLPPNAAFTDNGDGTGDFSWLTEPGDADNSPYDVTFTVTDSEVESDFEVVNITVHAEGQDGVFQQDPGPQGIVSIEAENYHYSLPQGGHSWDLEVNSGASGGLAMQAAPNNGTLVDDGYVTSCPRLDYDINFVQTGTYYIWVRGFAINGAADSVHAGLDGIDLDSAAGIKGFDPENEWVWENGPTRKTINITSGIHTLNLWMREDGFLFDKVVLTKDPDFVPEGFGPQESPR